MIRARCAISSANIGARYPIGLTSEPGKNRNREKCESGVKSADGDVIPSEYLENRASQRHGANSVGWKRDGPRKWCAVYGAGRVKCKVGSSKLEEIAVLKHMSRIKPISPPCDARLRA